MKTVTVRNKQSIWDLAIQHYGDPSGAAQLILDNSEVLNFSATPERGIKILIDETKVINATVVAYYEAKGLIPTTAIEILNDTTNGAFTSGFSSGFN